jgi:hypothetical protein
MTLLEWATNGILLNFNALCGFTDFRYYRLVGDEFYPAASSRMHNGILDSPPCGWRMTTTHEDDMLNGS